MEIKDLGELQIGQLESVIKEFEGLTGSSCEFYHCSSEVAGDLPSRVKQISNIGEFYLLLLKFEGSNYYNYLQMLIDIFSYLWGVDVSIFGDIIPGSDWNSVNMNNVPVSNLRIINETQFAIFVPLCVSEELVGEQIKYLTVKQFKSRLRGFLEDAEIY